MADVPLSPRLQSYVQDGRVFIEKEVVISASVEQMWHVLCDIPNYGHIFTGMHVMEWDGHYPEQGGRLVYEYHFGGVVVAGEDNVIRTGPGVAEIEITLHRLSWGKGGYVKSALDLQGVNLWRWSQREDGQLQLIGGLSYKLPSGYFEQRLEATIVREQLSRAWADTLENIKALAEAGQ